MACATLLYRNVIGHSIGCFVSAIKANLTSLSRLPFSVVSFLARVPIAASLTTEINLIGLSVFSTVGKMILFTEELLLSRGVSWPFS